MPKSSGIGPASESIDPRRGASRWRLCRNAPIRLGANEIDVSFHAAHSPNIRCKTALGYGPGFLTVIRPETRPSRKQEAAVDEKVASAQATKPRLVVNDQDFTVQN